MSAPILRLSTSQILMFLVNSRLGLFTAAPFTGAPLLPKLRGHFAEFLNKGSSARLRILSSPTCVGLRYGRWGLLEAFLGSLGTLTSLLVFNPHHTSAFSEDGFAYLLAFVLARLTNWALFFPFCVTPSSSTSSVQESPPVVHRLRFSASP